MNINTISCMSFGKITLQPGISIKNQKTSQKEKINFVQYEAGNEEDLKAIKYKTQAWNAGSNNYPLAKIIYDQLNTSKSTWEEDQPNCYTVYGFENADGDILTLGMTDSKGETKYFGNALDLSLLVVDPQYCYLQENRKYKGLGAMMTAKVLELAKQAGKDKVILSSCNDNFWKSSGLFQKEEPKTPEFNAAHTVPFFSISQNKFDNYINRAYRRQQI
ncbi:MAG: hypothetical protein PHX18_05575 [Candidatus Gastranaerophilales bacterium]|nr:hypothetical protein [Candidatus Gastranaerophilales bacterium]